MSEAPRAPDAPASPREESGRRRRPPGEQSCYAALDLGTNNCRLLVATPSPRGFRVVEAYSRIVRLGEGLSQTGMLSDAAMERSMAALKVCAEKIRRRKAIKIKAVATQACRGADNGAAFVQRVAEETGLRLQIITPREEAQLSVAGCMSLFDRESDAALVVDVGGGSTELSWVDLKGEGLDAKPRQFAAWKLPIKAWLSIPVGVVTLAERFPEGDRVEEGWFRTMVDDVKVRIEAFPHAEPMREVFASGRAHLVGTSGAITSLAGLHLGLERYDRNVVDGLWMDRTDCEAAAECLLRLTAAERALEPCIGSDRADLVLAGAAILQAVQEVWPCSRVRVADRGLREGLLMSLMSEQQRRPRRRRRGGASKFKPVSE
ncbi:Ppx/GppA phosphatase family protein [Caulobacter sp. DWR1-3-2b1]|uniref:Ppx/GppA phosphatase family protein n=1 Tax=Caulobacter sp. DWR1-3-2b1 TaxID=2804670 RepID=UPI003CE70D49